MKTKPRQRHFTLPVAVTLAAHAFLFFGFRSPQPAPPRPAPVSPPSAVPKHDVFEAVLAEAKPDDPPETPALRPPPLGLDSLGEPMPSDFRTPYESVAPAARTGITALVPVIWNPHGERGGLVPGTTLRLGDLDRLPRALVRVAPPYPLSLRAAGISGDVTVDFMVDEAGRVSDVRVVNSTHPGFEEAALRAVAKWRFEPGRRHGQPVRFRMSLPVRFSVGE